MGMHDAETSLPAHLTADLTADLPGLPASFSLALGVFPAFTGFPLPPVRPGTHGCCRTRLLTYSWGQCAGIRPGRHQL